ncbi:GNAT family N-acetyltransferase [Legionella sp. D16C41]|uniref:GNAT family N-acetyltransferase n=1 Tax=Legionella sp. D16C41 TaxID=3402688 RepID=UPI003AF436F1
MVAKFFNRHRHDLRFDWNAASKFDWQAIQRLFVAAYLKSYEGCSLNSLALSEQYIQQAKNRWQKAFKELTLENLEPIRLALIEPLKAYLSYNQQLLEQAFTDIKLHLQGKNHDIAKTRELLIKLTALKYQFEQDFKEEREKIALHKERLDYLVVRYQEQPIAFFVTELNKKSGRINLRWVTIAPSCHQQGLGKLILEQITNYYPEAIGMELYTRKVNHSAQQFYEHCGFKRAEELQFGRPTFENNKDKVILYLPEDDATNTPEEFIGFYKP